MKIRYEDSDLVMILDKSDVQALVNDKFAQVIGGREEIGAKNGEKIAIYPLFGLKNVIARFDRNGASKYIEVQLPQGYTREQIEKLHDKRFLLKQAPYNGILIRVEQ